MLITSTYQQLQQQLHEERPDYGDGHVSGRYHDMLRNLAQQLNTRSILDYGCGKAALQKSLPFPIQNYDPCMPEYSKRPQPADIVVCCDVLEHIEPECLANVLLDLSSLTKQVLFLNVACRPASKFLADGRNAHLIQESPNWWLAQLLPLFALTSFQIGKGEFTALLAPLHLQPEKAA